MNRTQLINQIQELKSALSRAEIELKSHTPPIEDAVVGDILADGCIVIQKFDGAALIAAPIITECTCVWGQFEYVFNNLAKQGFTPSQWFIPSVEQLKLAHKLIPDFFSAMNYWSSTEASSTAACGVNFGNGFQGTGSKTSSFCVRAFRLIVF